MSTNFLRILFASWLVIMLVEEAISLKEAVLHRVGYSAPLAVIKKQDSSLQLAIPHAYKSIGHLSLYNYDDSEDKNGPKEKLMIACPAFSEKQLKVEKKWRDSASLTTDKSKLLFLSDYSDENADCISSEFTPSINKAEENSDEYVTHCNELQADMYEVGYPVSTDQEGKDIRFLSTYKICYSKISGKEATLYSIHRIESPDLLFMTVIIELLDPMPLLFHSSYESVLDSSLSTKESLEGTVYYKHEFVGYNDLPNRRWKQTTNFLFNYAAITRNKALFKGMIRADWYIRLYSYKKNKPLNVYSGTHQKIIKNISPKIYKSPPVDSFWRVITDDAGNAIILVTQHTGQKCGDDYLCGKNRQVKKYKEGGCIYTCSPDANENLLEVLGLPPLKITGELDITLQTDKTAEVTDEGITISVSKPSQNTGIIEFLDEKYFWDALLNIDKNIFTKASFRPN